MAAAIQSEPPTDDRVYVFQDLRLDLGRRVLLQAGVPVLQAGAQRTPRPLHVLMVLAQAEGQVVTKEKLFEVVWDDKQVTEKALTYAVNQLRTALKPHGDLLVENVPRVGYRLDASWELLKTEIPDQAASEPAGPPGSPIQDSPPRDMEARTLLALMALFVIAALVNSGPPLVAGAWPSRSQLHPAHPGRIAKVRTTLDGRQPHLFQSGNPGWIPTRQHPCRRRGRDARFSAIGRYSQGG